MRQVVRFVCALAVAICCTSAQAQSQAYPNKFVRFVVTYPAGGSSDVMSRIVGQKLTDLWGQQVVVDSKPGAAGAIGRGRLRPRLPLLRAAR